MTPNMSQLKSTNETNWNQSATNKTNAKYTYEKILQNYMMLSPALTFLLNTSTLSNFSSQCKSKDYFKAFYQKENDHNLQKQSKIELNFFCIF